MTTKQNKIIDDISSQFVIDIDKKLLKQSIANQYDKGLEDMEFRLNMNFVRDSRKLNFLETFMFENIKGMTEDLADRLRKELSIAILNNENIEKIKKRVSDIMSVGKTRAQMIARTELVRAYNLGTFDAAKQSKVKTKKWLLITYDDRTTQVSKAMGEKYGSPDKAIDLNELFSVVVNGKTYEGLAPPFMPNDRDRLMIRFASDDKKEDEIEIKAEAVFQGKPGKWRTIMGKHVFFASDGTMLGGNGKKLDKGFLHKDFNKDKKENKEDKKDNKENTKQDVKQQIEKNLEKYSEHIKKAYSKVEPEHLKKNRI